MIIQNTKFEFLISRSAFEAKRKQAKRNKHIEISKLRKMQRDIVTSLMNRYD